jgi:hypothetical protein
MQPFAGMQVKGRKNSISFSLYFPLPNFPMLIELFGLEPWEDFQDLND